MDENKPAAKDDSLLNTFARTVGTTAGIIVSKATQFTEEAAAQASRVSKQAKASVRKAKTTKKRAVVKKKKAVARKRTVKGKKSAKRATGGRAKGRR
jgi:hypothetical protein